MIPHYPVVHRDHRTRPAFIVGFCMGFVVGVSLAFILLALWHGAI